MGLVDPHIGAEHLLTLCYPADADRLSVLSPAGASLLGLRVAWRGADGQCVTVELRAILYQSEASGDLLR